MACKKVVVKKDHTQADGRSADEDTAQDIADLSIAVELADVIDVSFVRSVADVELVQEHLAALRVRNGVTVPLMVEKRDDDNRVVDRLTIGVLHCFNKRYGSASQDKKTARTEKVKAAK